MKRIIAVVATVAAVAAMAQTPDAFEQFRRQMDSSFESVRKSNNETFERQRAEIDKSFADHMRKAWEIYNSSPSVPEPKRPEPVIIPKYVPTDKSSNEHTVTVVEDVPKVEPVKPVVAPKPAPTAPVATPEPKPAPTAPVVAPKPQPTAPVVEPKPEPKAPVATPEPKPAPTCPNQQPTCPKQQPTAPVVAPKPVPAAPVVAPNPQPTAPQSTTELTYFGTKVSIRVPGTAVPSLFDASEGAVADAWMSMGSGEYEQTLADCLAARSQMAISDWGYYRLVQMFAQKYYEAECNDAVLLQAYLLAHSGYRVRMARSGNQLVLLINIAGDVYGMSYFTIDGKRFYRTDKSTGCSRMYICDVKFPGENSFSLSHSCAPRLATKPLQVKHFASKRYPEAKADISVNANLMNYYKDYPLSDFAFYVRTSASESLKSQLYPMLRRVTAGKSQKDAVEIILNFVQTSFEYKTDDQQFGREKWFFGDEIFFYPYSDCDDRAILFSMLVRDVLNMEAVLLEYPRHLAAAVRFDSAVEGDYVMLGEKRFVVCDPTYIGAGVGEAMPNLDTKNIKLHKL